jgi:hypothetical protein
LNTLEKFVKIFWNKQQQPYVVHTWGWPVRPKHVVWNRRKWLKIPIKELLSKNSCT